MGKEEGIGKKEGQEAMLKMLGLGKINTEQKITIAPRKYNYMRCTDSLCHYYILFFILWISTNRIFFFWCFLHY